MIKSSDILCRIKQCPYDDTLYLIEKNSDISGFFALNGNIIYMMPNFNGCHNISIKTEFLHMETNIQVSAFNTPDQSFKNGFYNSIELFIQENDINTEKLEAFISLCNTYNSYFEEIDFVTFFDSLVKLFQLPKEQSYRNLIGLCGELVVIEYFYEMYKVDLSKYWHNAGVLSKLDFVTPSVNMEVKTTLNDELIFMIKHDQLFDNINDTYLVSVSLRKNNSGFTLNELAYRLLMSNEYCNSYDFAVNLEAEKLRISPEEAANIRFCLKEIRLFKTNEICPFDRIPERVSDLSYKINLIYSDYVDMQNFIKRIC